MWVPAGAIVLAKVYSNGFEWYACKFESGQSPSSPRRSSVQNLGYGPALCPRTMVMEQLFITFFSGGTRRVSRTGQALSHLTWALN